MVLHLRNHISSKEEDICKGSLEGTCLLQQFEIQTAIKTVVLRLTLRLSCVIVRKPKDILDLCHEEEGLKCDPCESPLFEDNHTTQGRKEVTAQVGKEQSHT